MSYTEIRPQGWLARYVACYWTSDEPAGAPPSVGRVLPDGCADLLFVLGAPITRLSGSVRATHAEGGYVVGLMQRAVPVERVGGTRIFAVRFRPGGAAAFLRPPQHELADRMEPLSCLWGAGADELAEQLAAALDTAARVRLVEAALLRRHLPERPQDAAIREAVRRIERAGGQVSVEALARDVGLGARSLERLFLARVGQSPKQLGRVLRLRHALSAVRPGGAAAWARVALDGGYYDQSHFIREVRALTGVTPTELLAG